SKVYKRSKAIWRDRALRGAETAAGRTRRSIWVFWGSGQTFSYRTGSAVSAPGASPSSRWRALFVPAYCSGLGAARRVPGFKGYVRTRRKRRRRPGGAPTTDREHTAARGSREGDSLVWGGAPRGAPPPVAKVPASAVILPGGPKDLRGRRHREPGRAHRSLSKS